MAYRWRGFPCRCFDGNSNGGCGDDVTRRLARARGLTGSWLGRCGGRRRCWGRRRCGGRRRVSRGVCNTTRRRRHFRWLIVDSVGIDSDRWLDRCRCVAQTQGAGCTKAHAGSSGVAEPRCLLLLLCPPVCLRFCLRRLGPSLRERLGPLSRQLLCCLLRGGGGDACGLGFLGLGLRRRGPRLTNVQRHGGKAPLFALGPLFTQQAAQAVPLGPILAQPPRRVQCQPIEEQHHEHAQRDWICLHRQERQRLAAIDVRDRRGAHRRGGRGHPKRGKLCGGDGQLVDFAANVVVGWWQRAHADLAPRTQGGVPKMTLRLQLARRTSPAVCADAPSVVAAATAVALVAKVVLRAVTDSIHCLANQRRQSRRQRHRRRRGHRWRRWRLGGWGWGCRWGGRRGRHRRRRRRGRWRGGWRRRWRRGRWQGWRRGRRWRGRYHRGRRRESERRGRRKRWWCGRRWRWGRRSDSDHVCRHGGHLLHSNPDGRSDHRGRTFEDV